MQAKREKIAIAGKEKGAIVCDRLSPTGKGLFTEQGRQIAA
jgi:hypothetical protein